MAAPGSIKIPSPDNDDIYDNSKIFSFYVGTEKVYISKVEAINLINILSGQLYAYELARS